MIEDKIKELRVKILVHACIYDMGEVMMARKNWEAMADELLRLQERHIDKCNIGLFDDLFRSWDGRTTAQLPLRDERIINRAQWLIDNKDFTPNLL